MNNLRIVQIFLLSVILIFAMSPRAHAYIDPNAGSLFLQLVIGGVAGLLLILKLFWKKIVSFFKKGGLR